jgi:hypothetical protein
MCIAQVFGRLLTVDHGASRCFAESVTLAS